MRWTGNEVLANNQNEQRRIVRRFQWFPCQIGNQVRWLEWVTVAQREKHVHVECIWEDTAWIDGKVKQ